jgi:large subunit ribosomal protein L19e
MASRIMKCGVTRVWINPERIADVEEAITAEDVRSLIRDGVIRARQKKGLSNFRRKKAALQKQKGRRRGRGSRKGSVSRQAGRLWPRGV